MNITDEQLSAFLDAELPAAAMEAIREQLLEDEALADRLAELALVDELVAASARQIDSRPTPHAVSALFQASPTAAVIHFPLWKRALWKRVQRGLQQPIAIAASVALIIGFGVTQLQHHSAQDSGWVGVAQVLETSPSGVTHFINEHAEVKPRLTFNNYQGDYCRQFELSDATGASENIACRQQGKWQLITSVKQRQNQSASEYQTASGGSVLEEALEQMVKGNIFNAQTETEIISARWTTKP